VPEPSRGGVKLAMIASLLLALALTASPGGAAAVRKQPPTTADGRAVPGLSARLKLPSETVAAGAEIPATVVVRNTTGHRVTVRGCGSLFKVALRSSKVHPEELLAWPACSEKISIPAGASRYPLTVAARYVACFGASRQPICDGDQPPALPPGEYRARLPAFG
jgi:hypothetical protein